jgi:hypothetical protein
MIVIPPELHSLQAHESLHRAAWVDDEVDDREARTIQVSSERMIGVQLLSLNLQFRQVDFFKADSPQVEGESVLQFSGGWMHKEPPFVVCRTDCQSVLQTTRFIFNMPSQFGVKTARKRT